MAEAAAAELTRNKSPRLTGECEWADAIITIVFVGYGPYIMKTIFSPTTQNYNEISQADLLPEK